MEGESDTIIGQSSKCSKTNVFLYSKIALGIILPVGMIVYVLVDYSSLCSTFEVILDFLSYLGIWGWLLFIGIFSVATCLLVPGIIMTVGAGFIYTRLYGTCAGILIGTLLVFLGASLGSIIAMLLCRWLFREHMRNNIEKHPKMQIIDEWMGEKGFRVLFMLRLSPLLPYNIFNYLVGLTSISLKHYSLANLGLLPGIIAYVYIGSVVNNLAEAVQNDFADSWFELTLVIVGAVIALISVVYITYSTRKRIKEKLEYEQGSI